MKSKVIYIFLGIVSILIGGLLLADSIGLVDLRPVTKDAGFFIFLTGSVIFFLAYFLHGIRKWGWLFPALFCTALTLMIGMKQSGMEDRFSATLLFTGWALPFFAGYIVNRKRWLLVPGIFLSSFAIFLLVSETRAGDTSGAVFFGMFALSFFAAYLLMKRPWWLLLPAGVSASLGLTLLIDSLVPHQEYPVHPGMMNWDFFSWVLFLGLVITFAAIWLHRKNQPTAWAIYPAGGLLAIGLLILFLGEHFQDIWFPVMILATGATLLSTVFTWKRQKPDRTTSGIQG